MDWGHSHLSVYIDDLNPQWRCKLTEILQ